MDEKLSPYVLLPDGTLKPWEEVEKEKLGEIKEEEPSFEVVSNKRYFVLPRRQPLSTERYGILPITYDENTGVVGANQWCCFAVRPQIIFRPERLWIDSECARDFFITDIKIGNRTEFVSAGSVPATIFAQDLSELNQLLRFRIAKTIEETSIVVCDVNMDALEMMRMFSPPLKMEPVLPGMEMFISVKNIGMCMRRFSGAFFGQVLH